VTLGIASGKAAGVKVIRRLGFGKEAVVLRIRKTINGTKAESVAVGWRRGPLVLWTRRPLSPRLIPLTATARRSGRCS
jgi:hypothetical protein